MVLEIPGVMRVNTLHRIFKFQNGTDLKVQTSITTSLPSTSFSFLGALEAKASCCQ